jgi:rhodanese-related sulfurtransferase
MLNNLIKLTLVSALSLALVLPNISYAVEIKTSIQHAQLIEEKQSESNKYLTAQETYNIVTTNPQKVLFIDVRTPSEIEFVGWSPLVDAVIPYMSNDFDEWDEQSQRYTKVINGDFPIVFEELLTEKRFNKDTPIIFMCRSGTRSARAASLATKLGFTQAYTVVDGFEGDLAGEGPNKGHRVINGWKNSQLPWSYEVDGLRILFNQ